MAFNHDPAPHELDSIVETFADAESYDPAEQEKGLIAEINEWWASDQTQRQEYSTDWEFYRDFLKGKCNIARDRETNTLIRIEERDTHKIRSRINILRPTSRSLIGKMTRSIPSVEVIPATADFEEQHGAKVAEQLLEHCRRVENMNVKYIEAIECLPWAGNGFWYLEWNRFGGEKRLWCPACDYEVDPEGVEDHTCPQCAQQRMMESQAYEMAIQQAEQQQMMEVAGQLGPGIQPDLSMVPMDVPPPEPQQMGPLALDQEVPELQEVFTGAPCVQVIDPRFVYPEAGATSLEKAQRVTLCYPVPVAELRREFPERGMYIHEDDHLLLSETIFRDHGTFAGEAESSALNNHAMLWIIMHKPTQRHPQGRIIYRVNDMVVRQLGIDLESQLPISEQEPNPFHILDRFPLYHIGFDHNTGELWFEPYIEQAWSMQQELNRVDTQVAEHTALGLKPKALVPINSRISVSEITSSSDQLIKYNPIAGEIKPFAFPPLSNQVLERRMMLIDGIRQQATVTEQEAGISQSDPNGRASAILEAEADQQMGPFMVRIHHEWQELHRGILQLFQAFGDENTKFTVAGVDAPETYYFNELILKPGWDVQLEQQDGLSNNKAVRLNQALELLNAGVFTDVTTGAIDTKAFMRQARVNLRQAGYDLEATERAAAAQIPVLIQAGGQWMPQLEDDPERFGEVLLGWLRGPGRRLKESNPQVVDQVRQIWVFYTTWALSGQIPGTPMASGGPPGGQGGSGAGGPDMTAPGGTPNSPGSIQQESQAMVSQADQQGETQAAVQQNHEG